MSKPFYKKNSSQSAGSNTVKTYKFDENLNAKTYVEFILNLRNNESIGFGLAQESIKEEAKIIYYFPKPPPMSIAEHKEWKNTLEYEVYKRQMTNILDQAGKYSEACNKACEILLSSKHMSDEIRTAVIDHPLCNDSCPESGVNLTID
jgi:hypothetical protein